MDLIYCGQLTDLRSVSTLDNHLITKQKALTSLSSRRSSLEIAVDVLQVINDGETQPTRIMYSCNLSWNSVKKSLALLTAKEFLDEETQGKKKQYSITRKGKEVLSYHSNLESLIQVT